MAVHYVHDKSELLDVVNHGLEDGAEIRIMSSLDCENIYGLNVHASGVTFVGDGTRPTIRCNAENWPVKSSLFKIQGDGCRFVNLTLDGGYYLQDLIQDVQARHACGISVDSGSVHVENCTILGWPASGVRVNADASGTIVNCILRKCRQYSLGYCASVYNGNLLVERNIMSEFRHAIAGGFNSPKTCYVARHNVVMMTEVHHKPNGQVTFATAFDMHGKDSGTPGGGGKRTTPNHRFPQLKLNPEYSADPNQSGGVAGNQILIEGNVIVNRTSYERDAIGIRGEPMGSVNIVGNFLFPGDGVSNRLHIKIPLCADIRRFFIYGNQFLTTDPFDAWPVGYLDS